MSLSLPFSSPSSSSEQHQLELRPETKEFLFTLFKYVESHKLLDEKYQQVDEDSILATRTIGIGNNSSSSGGMIVSDSSSSDNNTAAKKKKKNIVYRQEYQQQKVSGEVVESLDDLYQAAKVVQPHFVEAIQRLVKPVEQTCNCTSSFYHPTKTEVSTTPPPLPSAVIAKRRSSQIEMPATTNNDNDEEQEIKVTIAPFKGRERAMEKAQDDYSHRNPGPGFSWLFDIVRASIEFGSVTQLVEFMNVLEADPSIHIVQAKNRFQIPTLTGYRDLNLHVQLQVPSVTSAGEEEDGEEQTRMIKFVCELQIHHRAIKELQGELESHKYYEYFRSFFGGATGTLKSRLEDLQQIGNGRALDEQMLVSFLKSNMDEERIVLLAKLFEDQFAELEWALKMQRRLLEIRQEKYNLSIQVAKWKDMSEAAREEVERKARALSSTYRNMGRILVKQGDIDQALSLYRKSRKESYKMNKQLNKKGTYCQENDLLVAEAHNVIGILETKRNAFRRAIDMHKAALKLYTEAFGDYHPSIAVTYGNMGNALMQMEKFDKAVHLYGQSLDIFQVNLGEDHFCVWNTLNNMGVLLSEQGKYPEALQKFEESLSFSEMALGVGAHQQQAALPFHANLYNNMGVALERLYCSDTKNNEKSLEEAVQKYRLALETFKKILGDDHFAMIGTYNNLSNALAKQGNLDQAIDMVDKSISIQSRVFGENHLDLVVLYEAKMKICQMRDAPPHELILEIGGEMKRIRMTHEMEKKYKRYGGKHGHHHLPGGYKPMWNKHRTWHTTAAEWKDQLMENNNSKWQQTNWPTGLVDSSMRFPPSRAGGGMQSYFAGPSDSMTQWNNSQFMSFPSWASSRFSVGSA